MPKYSPLTRQLAKWMYQFIDRYDWGAFNRKLGHPVPNLSRDAFCHLKNLPKGIVPFYGVRRLTMTLIEAHLDHDQTIYFRSFRRSERWLLKIDIDAKGDGTRPEHAEAAAAYIANVLYKGLYYEPSTGGKGRHVYLVIERGRVSYQNWKALLRRYVDSLQALIDRKGWKVHVDRICGLPTKFSSAADENCEHYWTIKDGDCGVLAKCPRLPMGELSLNQLVTSPVLKAKDIERVVTRGEKAQTKLRDIPPLPSGEENRRYSDMLTKFSFSPQISVETIRFVKDAFERMHFACTYYAMLHRRFPENGLALMEFYEDNDFHSGVSDRERRARHKRAVSVLKYQQSRCTEDMLGVFGFVGEVFRNLVREHVKPEHRHGTKCDREITEDDLAVALYVIERNATKRSTTRKRQGTTGFQSIIDMSRVLRDAGLLRRALNPNQACAVRKILVNAGLVTLEDGGYFAGGPEHGWCRKYGVGHCSPRRAFYEQFCETISREMCEQTPVQEMPVQEVAEELEASRELPRVRVTAPKPLVIDSENFWGTEEVCVGEPDDDPELDFDP